jgi:hypothetical protein
MTYSFNRRNALIALSACLIGFPAVSSAQEEGKETGDPLTVELPSMALPIVKDGQLTNYLFCVIQIQVSDASSAFFFREQSYLLRDAIIRIASRMPVPAGATPRSFDRVAVTRIVMQAVSGVRPSTRLVRVTALDPAFMRN